MSLTRQFFRELRPFFHMLEEPFGRAPTAAYPAFRDLSPRSLFDDAFFAGPGSGALRPALDVSEQGDSYVVEADLPGVKKENVHVRVGDGGRSLTIEGEVFARSPQEPVQAPPTTEGASSEAPSSSAEGMFSAIMSMPGTLVADENFVITQPEQRATAIATERVFSGTSRFTRTVLLPQAVDSSKVTAKLADGVLTVTVPKAADTGSVTINVE